MSKFINVKKITLWTLMFAITLVSFLAVPDNTSAAMTSKVKLLYAREGSSNYNLFAYGYVQAELAANCKVTVRYTCDSGPEAGVWKDTVATYVGPTYGNYGAWRFETQGVPDPMISYVKQGVNFRFAVKYEVDGQTYWDNNNGADYYLSAGYTAKYPRMILSESVVALNYANGFKNTDSTFIGTIYLKNLGYDKVVKVVYSYDNWVTTKECTATYQANVGNNTESWTFQGSVPTQATEVKFAIAYTVNGVTYWDNNFNSNYTLSIPGSLPIFN
ncbi:MAG: CBM21 domain-containing protein [Clostridia bacterium]|nr:CBM21 domain-containing protein [Clostridia bacterium]